MLYKSSQRDGADVANAVRDELHGHHRALQPRHREHAVEKGRPVDQVGRVEPDLGFGRIVALYDHSSALHQIH